LFNETKKKEKTGKELVDEAISIIDEGVIQERIPKN
jgi:hypothetical protein